MGYGRQRQPWMYITKKDVCGYWGWLLAKENLFLAEITWQQAWANIAAVIQVQ